MIGILIATTWAMTFWLAYRWGRHVENPCFWEEPKAKVAETSDTDPRKPSADGESIPDSVKNQP